jgi:hypothetical protein
MSKYYQWPLVGLIILTSAALMVNASLKESATMDELAHIPSGYGYVKYFDYRLNPEHPPLVKAIAAIPLLFQKLNFPTDRSAWQNDINSQWAVGAQFLYESGNNPDKIIQWSRLGPILLTLLLVLFIFIWSSELIGGWWALLPTALFALSPTVLAHGHFVTTDVGAALGIFIAFYYFIKFLFESSRRHLAFAGIAFGIAQLMKFSAVLIIPFFGFLLIIFCFWKIRDGAGKPFFGKIWQFLKTFIRYVLYLISIFIIGYFLVYIVYFLFTVNYPIEKQKADTSFTLTSFANGPDPNWETCKLNSGVALNRRIRCVANVNVWMAGNKILRPVAEYILGVLMVMQRSSGGNTSYFLGEVSASGWWYYFPVLFVLKEPIPSLILIAFAFLLGLWGILKGLKPITLCCKKFYDYLGTHFAEFSMLSFVIFYWAYSIKSPLNIGIRHILPTMPFIYILTASALKNWFGIQKNAPWQNLLKPLTNLLKISSKGLLVGILIVWYLAETALASPYFLSYFNEFGGGVKNGYRYVTDSNYDWGQDLKRLAKLADEKGINKIAINYFGGGNPEYYMPGKAVDWQSSKGNPKDYGIKWFAISINNLQSALGKLHPGQQRNPEDEYSWLKETRDPYKPDFRAGTSIFIYKL